MYFILTQDLGDLLRRLQGNRSKSIGMRAQQRRIIMHINCFFGRNIRPISFISEECTVAPFLEDYSEQVNIPICTGATFYTMESGEVRILIFGQGLWFDNRMEKL